MQLMTFRCRCSICHGHRRAGLLLYSTRRQFSELGPLQQKIHLERISAHGACKVGPPPFYPRDLSGTQLQKYPHLWDGVAERMCINRGRAGCIRYKYL